MNYTIGYIDFETNALSSSENLYEDITLAAYDLNFTVCDLILKKYDILLRNSFLFVCNDSLKHSINTVKISSNKSIVTEKKGLELDIYLLNEKKGYIYNGQEKVHVYKFFINKHTNSLNNEPFEVKRSSIPKPPFEQGEIVDIANEEQKSAISNSCTDNLITEPAGWRQVSFRREEEQKTVTFDPYTNVLTPRELDMQIPNRLEDNVDSKEISFTKEDLVVLENWLDKNELFVKELSEKVKKYKVD